MEREEGSLPKSQSFSSFRNVDLPEVAQISPRVIRILGCNSGSYTLQGTNTYLVGTGKSRVLVDCGEAGNKAYLSLLERTLTSLNVEIEKILVTHHHHDHLGGVRGVISSCLPSTSRPLPVHKIKRISVPDEESAAPDGYSFLQDSNIISTQGATLRVISTPGHTEDHMGLLLEEEGIFFSGDCILGQTRPVFEDMELYERSLKRIKRMKEIKKIFPGHGPVIEDPKWKVEDYLRSIERREKLILDTLRNAGGKSLTTAQIVDRIYLDISPVLRFGASMTVENHIRMLCKQNKISSDSSTNSFKLPNQCSFNDAYSPYRMDHMA